MASEIKANKISPATGTAFTLGDSGDTFTLPSGATLSGAGAITVPSGGSLTIDSGATITNNGTATNFGGSNLEAAFSETREGGYFASGGDRVFTKITIGEASAVRQFDTASGFDDANNRWVVPSGKAGTYITSHGTYGRNNNGNANYAASGLLYKNGVAQTNTYSVSYSANAAASPWGFYNFGPWIIELAEGDYLEWYTAIDFGSTADFMGWRVWGFKLT